MTARSDWTVWCDGEGINCQFFCPAFGDTRKMAIDSALSYGWHQARIDGQLRHYCPICWKRGVR